MANIINVGQKVRDNFIKNRGVSYQNIALLVTIAVVSVITSIISPVFLTKVNLINVFQQISITGIVTLGASLVIISQGVDLSVGTMISLVTCTVATLFNKGVNLAVAAMIGILVAVCAGFINGIIISRTKAEPFIVTLGMMSVFQGLALLASGGVNASMNDNFGFLGQEKILSIPVSVIIFLLIYLILNFVMRYSKFGRRVYAIGGNQEAAFLAGINIKMYKLIIYTINGLIVGIASLILLSRLGSANATVGIGFELQAIAAAVIGGISLSGGKGNVFGGFLGILLLGLISNALNILNIPSFFQNIILGGIIVGAVVLSSYDKNN